ncbi:hypothetical protein ACHAXA_004856 [Cyclostephanos tholiformis]|uniref:Mitochondrial pyruvate carrier n=1 Tax=Cyclostephanos tholiformis TaxID=382380 RepID=A0ABD3SH09_9STRA
MIGRMLLLRPPSSAATRKISSSISLSSNVRRLTGTTPPGVVGAPPSTMSSQSSRTSRLSTYKPGRVVVVDDHRGTTSAAVAARRTFGNKKSDAKPGGGVDGSSSWWDSAAFWGRCGAIAGWVSAAITGDSDDARRRANNIERRARQMGMSGAAIYDALQSSPELISLNMTGVLIVYSSMFARWAFVVKPQNLLLAGCHVANVCAQGNQLRRAVEYKGERGMDGEVRDILAKAAMTVIAGAACVIVGPTLQGAIVNANLGPISTVAAADAGPFTVHFWAPMSKWMISGASFLELDRPTEKISIAQYTALTLTGFFFTRYALLVTPINYTLW